LGWPLNMAALRRDLAARYPVEAGELARRCLAATIANIRIPERATAVDPEPKPPEADTEACDGAGSSSEAAPAERASGCATSLSRMPGDTGKAGRVGEGDGSSPPDWRAARRALRQAGREIAQHDGAVYVDGLLSRDPALYPPELAVPA
jgi:hypothetical protein